MATDQDAATILELFAHPPRPIRIGGQVIIALDGRSGSGKTRLARAVTALDSRIHVIAIESFYHGWHGLRAGAPRLIREVLRPWAAGLPAQARVWDWDIGAWSQRVTPQPLPASGRALIEGCGAGALELAPFTSALGWREAATDVRFARAMCRDGEAVAPCWDTWPRQEAALIASHQAPQRADLLLHSPPDPSPAPRTQSVPPLPPRGQ